MRISIVMGPWFPVPALQGGAVNRLWQGLAEEFATAGHDVTMLCRSYPSQPERETINGVNYIRRSGYSQSRSITLDLIKDLVYAIRVTPTLPRADIVVINDFWIPLLAAMLRSNAGRIVINVNRFPKRQFFLYAGAARFAAASRAIEEAISKQHKSAASRTRVLPNPIDTEIFSPPESLRRMKKDSTVLYVGRVHPEKGVHLLIEAFALLSQQLPETKLRILGPVKENQGGGGESYMRSLKAKAQGLNVEFSEPIFDVYRLADAYKEADVFCYPSLAEKGESFGVAPLEAMSSGLVPVVSDLDCFKDFIIQDQTGYFFDHKLPDRAEKLSEALLSVIMDLEKTYQISINAIQKAQQFSYKRIAALYLEDFENLIKA
jgi:glycosyltransferase involved in cell wall biosynthesis